jgi:hypothetical protein
MRRKWIFSCEYIRKVQRSTVLKTGEATIDSRRAANDMLVFLAVGIFGLSAIYLPLWSMV